MASGRHDEIPEDHGTRLHVADGVVAGRSWSTTPPRSIAWAPGGDRPADLVRTGGPAATASLIASLPSPAPSSPGSPATICLRASRAGSEPGGVRGRIQPADRRGGRHLLARQGVCRDFAHLVIAFLRAWRSPPSSRRSTRPVSARWTSMPSSRPGSTASGTSSTPRASPRGRRWCASRRVATPRTRRS